MCGLARKPRGASPGAHGRALVVYLWDLPPVGTGRGRPDPVWWLAGRLLRLPRPWGGYGRRRGYYSRLRYIARRADAVWVPSTLTRETVARALRRAGSSGSRIAMTPTRFVPAAVGAGRAAGAAHRVATAAHKNQAAVLHAAARARPGGPRASDRSRTGAARARGAGRATRRAAARVETEADDADGDAGVSRGRGGGLSQPIRGIRAHAGRGGRVRRARGGLGHPAAPRVRRAGGPAGPARRSPTRSPRRSRAALDAPPADPALVRDLTIPAAADALSGLARAIPALD